MRSFIGFGGLAAAMAFAASACSVFGPPAVTDAMPPPQCQQLIDQCGALAAEAGISAADDCVRLATEGSTTAERCVEVQAACAAACGVGVDASGDP